VLVQNALTTGLLAYVPDEILVIEGGFLRSVLAETRRGGCSAEPLGKDDAG
jgi:hypothetical protein